MQLIYKAQCDETGFMPMSPTKAKKGPVLFAA